MAVEGVRADLWCRTCESVVPGRSRSTTARDLPANDCSRVSSGVDSEVESRPASADFESLTLRSRVVGMPPTPFGGCQRRLERRSGGSENRKL